MSGHDHAPGRTCRRSTQPSRSPPANCETSDARHCGYWWARRAPKWAVLAGVDSSSWISSRIEINSRDTEDHVRDAGLQELASVRGLAPGLAPADAGCSVD